MHTRSVFHVEANTKQKPRYQLWLYEREEGFINMVVLCNTKQARETLTNLVIVDVFKLLYLHTSIQWSVCQSSKCTKIIIGHVNLVISWH